MSFLIIDIGSCLDLGHCGHLHTSFGTLSISTQTPWRTHVTFEYEGLPVAEPERYTSAFPWNLSNPDTYLIPLFSAYESGEINFSELQ